MRYSRSWGYPFPIRTVLGSKMDSVKKRNFGYRKAYKDSIERVQKEDVLRHNDLLSALKKIDPMILPDLDPMPWPISGVRNSNDKGYLLLWYAFVLQDAYHRVLESFRVTNGCEVTCKNSGKNLYYDCVITYKDNLGNSRMFRSYQKDHIECMTWVIDTLNTIKNNG
jgi:hypothetical protein